MECFGQSVYLFVGLHIFQFVAIPSANNINTEVIGRSYIRLAFWKFVNGSLMASARGHDSGSASGCGTWMLASGGVILSRQLALKVPVVVRPKLLSNKQS